MPKATLYYLLYTICPRCLVCADGNICSNWMFNLEVEQLVKAELLKPLEYTVGVCRSRDVNSVWPLPDCFQCRDCAVADRRMRV
ncbi:hypothetical protein DFH08DRAFT_852891, partial [Mycena albidolilacea]